MKKTKLLITVLLFVCVTIFNLNAQGQLTTGIQTSSISTPSNNWVESTSDKNKSYHAVAYWVGGENCGNYLRIYDGINFTPTSPEILISDHHGFTRVRLDDENNVYVIYIDRISPGSTIFRTYIKKYNIYGTLMALRVKVVSNNNPSDIEVAPNGDVLIACQEANKAKIKIYRNMSYKGYYPLGNIAEINGYSPFVIQTDMKNNKLVVSYSHGSITASHLIIKRISYIPHFISGYVNVSTTQSTYGETGVRLSHRNNQIALRTNGDVFYTVNNSNLSPIFKVKKLSGNTTSVFQTGNAYVDVDIQNRLLVSKDYGMPAYGNFTIKLYSSSDSFIYEYTPSNTIKNHLSSIAIYDCEFIITGIDRNTFGNPAANTYESFHQIFNCKDCRPNLGATAVAKFRLPYHINSVPSKYGPLEVTELCLVDDLLVNGALSSCENAYFVGLSEFNPITWTETLVLHSNWVYPLTQAPNAINIVDFLPTGYHLRPGKIYKFRFAVGTPWDSVDLFFEVSCCDRGLVVEKEEDIPTEIFIPEYKLSNTDQIEEDTTLNVRIYPNPIKNKLTLDYSLFKTDSKIAISIQTFSGTQVFSKNTSDKKIELNTSKWPAGIYICKSIIDYQTYTKKIIKE